LAKTNSKGTADVIQDNTDGPDVNLFVGKATESMKNKGRVLEIKIIFLLFRKSV